MGAGRELLSSLNGLDLSGLLALATLDDGVSHNGGDELDGADSVIVTGDHVVSIVGIAVGVNDSDYGDAKLLCLKNSDVLLVGVNDEDSVRELLHGLDAGIPSG